MNKYEQVDMNKRQNIKFIMIEIIKSEFCNINMEYINVSQFYQSVICFAIPLLVIQRVILFVSNLSSHYQDYRISLYEHQFAFTEEYSQQKTLSTSEPQAPQQTTIKQRMLYVTYGVNEDIILPAEHNQIRISELNKRDIQQKDQDEQINISDKVKQQSISQPNNTMKQQVQDNENMQNMDSQQQQNKEVVVKKPSYSIQQIRQTHISEVQVANVKLQTVAEEEVQRKITKINEQIITKKQKSFVEQDTGEFELQTEVQKLKLKYCRRVDDAFNDYIPIVLSVVVLGLLTESVFIYSMCCFFGYAFSSLLFNYSHLLDKLQGYEKKTFFSKSNQLISSLFIMALFISYWISNQFK